MSMCCYGCKDRAVGCHIDCQKYKEFVQKKEAEREDRIRRNDEIQIIYEAVKRRKRD